MTTEIENLLQSDPLLDAETLTGASYKDDEGTLALGMVLHLEKSARVREEMGLRDDTHYGSDFEQALRVLAELGFSIIHEHAFSPKTYSGEDTARNERYIILWRAGVLATLTSYQETRVNTFEIHYNWRQNEGVKPFQYTSSGHYDSDSYDNGEYVWIGHHDVRTGLRHTLSNLEHNGEFLNIWIERPFLWFVDYAQEKVEGYDYKAITKQVIATFPIEVIAAIGAK